MARTASCLVGRGDSWSGWEDCEPERCGDVFVWLWLWLLVVLLLLLLLRSGECAGGFPRDAGGRVGKV